MTPSGAKADVQNPRRVVVLWSILFALFAASWLGFFVLNPDVLTKIGVGHYRIETAPQRFQEVWFLDTLAILAANDAATAGADPYARNRLDYFHRPHVYGPAWLYLRHLGLTRFHTLIAGMALIVAFLGTAVLFLRPHCPISLLWCIAILCTTPILTALERANNDLVIFLLLMPLIPCLLSRHQAARWIAVPLIILATALKYYPATACLLLFAQPATAREVWWRLTAAAVALALVAWHIAANVPTMALLPQPAGVFSFGAIGVFRELGIHGIVPQMVAIGFALGAMVFWWRSPRLRDWHPDPFVQREWLHFILGSVLLTGCFFVGQHFAYRWIFAIWLAPFLWAIPRDRKVPSGVRALARATGWLLLVLLWTEAILVFALHHWLPDLLIPALHWVFLAMQPFTWAFFLCLLGFLMKFLRDGLLELLAGKKSSPPTDSTAHYADGTYSTEFRATRSQV